MNTQNTKTQTGACNAKREARSNEGTAPHFKATLFLASKREAMEAVDILNILKRSNEHFEFVARVGKGKKNVEFYCDGPQSALFFRNRYFRDSTVTWF